MKTKIKIKETIETYQNSGNPSHPYNGQKILTVSVVEVADYGADIIIEDIIKNFGGEFDQDDVQVRSEAAAYASKQAEADAEYCNRYEAFVARRDETEWEY